MKSVARYLVELSRLSVLGELRSIFGRCVLTAGPLVVEIEVVDLEE
jgi:hypothetical protein